ncbi:hypothetical protein KA119_01535 [Candidatus Gracilibacteria bacterium]|nr:hypothetical protein [Candidatus Gracilibacteria bacterium]
MKKLLFEMLFIVADKILPKSVLARLPLALIEPNCLSLNATAEWSSQQSFFIYNLYKRPLFDVYLMIDLNNSDYSDMQIDKRNINSEHELLIGDTIWNYDVVINCCIINDDRKVIILRIHQLNVEAKEQFKVIAKSQCKINLRILGFSFSESQIAIKENALAIPLNIPNKFGIKDIKLVSQSIRTRKIS